ncbi:MAG: Uma2 family endonuclease [Deltaproteobacteria bacterium]|nr:Uma2 family endonuclease [Deltaproteobacteria bacterium]
MSSLAQSRYTPDHYLALERQAKHRSEYINGSIFAMVGASRQHNLIAGNVFGELRTQLRGRPCEAYINDMRVKVSVTGLYTYPDVAALCGEPYFEDARMDTLLNPNVIVEVLSDSTEAYDRGEKFAHYRRLESLRDYVLIAQNKVRVEHYVRQGDQWVLSEASDLASTVLLSSIGCEVGLRDIYERVEFASNEAGTPSRGGAA